MKLLIRVALFFFLLIFYGNTSNAQVKSSEVDFCSKINLAINFVTSKKQLDPDSKDPVGLPKKKSLYPNLVYGLNERKIFASLLKLPNEISGEFIKNDGIWTFVCSFGSSNKTDKIKLSKKAQEIKQILLKCLSIAEWKIDTKSNKDVNNIVYMSNKKTDAQITLSIWTKENICNIIFMLTKP